MPNPLGAQVDLKSVSVIKVDDAVTEASDLVAREEPLEIRLWSDTDGATPKSISITMRTPGDDFELAAGFLFTENIIQHPSQIAGIRFCGKEGDEKNIVKVELAGDFLPDISRLERNFYTTSSCGVCGKTSIDALSVGACKISPDEFKVDSDTVHSLPDTLRMRQNVFEFTGGLHAAGLFDADGTLLTIREDVGRHNAVDKLIGGFFLAGKTPLSRSILALSGRASFELIQKAVVAGIPVVTAVGAPSSLAIEAAAEFGVTLLGFVRDQRFNIYTHPERINTSVKR